MAVTLGDGLFAVAILAGGLMCWLGVHCYRRWDEPGVVPFTAMAILLGLGGIVGSVVAITRGGAIPEQGVPVWSNIALTGWALAMVPWLLFALQYTGRYTRFRWRTVGAMTLPVVGIVLLLLVEFVDAFDVGVVISFFGTLTLLYVLALSIVGSYLLVRTTHEYGHLSLQQGVALAVAGVGPLVVVNSIGILVRGTSEVVVFVAYAVAFVIPAVALSLAVFRYDTFESTPAAGTLGERAIPRETDDVIVVVDQDGRVVKINETGAETLGVSLTDPLGEPFTSLLCRSVEDLQAADTIELETADGKRKFDPQVTAFTDQHDRCLGHLLSLRDVTERELRKQRLEVLNRVLRHNLRNRVDVIKSNAEAVTAEVDSEHATAIRESADQLATLSSKARATDALVSRPARRTEADLAAAVRDLVDTDGTGVAVTLTLPDAAPLVTDWEALEDAIESAVENALDYAETSVTVTVEEVDGGYEVTVSDDGPGIPESELASLDAETETPLQHGTGLGLWQLKWGVTKVGGDLSFDTSDGTTVRMTVPDQGESG